ncbi:DUF1349 domain-containing protein [Luteococcus peritonei]|uniref:DUF1349 domain-containing protein n=1 Tax=Luteococcus peritonei TaxID=88874 RepID=A0ABW4RYH6_9ACTN
MPTVDWSAGRWTTEPVRSEVTENGLLVEAREGSDAWRTTSYGFIHDDEHALVAPLGQEQAVEVDFVAAFSQQFDQAGVFLRAGQEHWVKAGVEFADGTPQLGAVVTSPCSDWSVAPVPDWDGRTVTVRASRSGDAVTIRARVDGGDFRLVRVVPMDPEVELEAGPFTCAPTRPGLEVLFTGWRLTEPDASLHP